MVAKRARLFPAGKNATLADKLGAVRVRENDIAASQEPILFFGNLMRHSSDKRHVELSGLRDIIHPQMRHAVDDFFLTTGVSRLNCEQDVAIAEHYTFPFFHSAASELRISSKFFSFRRMGRCSSVSTESLRPFSGLFAGEK